MRYEREFVVRQASRTDGLNQVVCISVICMESFRIMARWLSCRAAAQPMDPGYIRLYLAVLVLAGGFWTMDHFSRGHTNLHYAAQFTGLVSGLVWSMTCAVFEAKHGNAGTVLPQILLLTSAGLRSPGPLHLGVNAVVCLTYILVLSVSGLPAQVLGREIADTILYLFISGVIIQATYHFQYESYCMERKNLQIRDAQLDGMSEQLEQTRQMARAVREIRHDMRHYVWEVQQALDCGDFAAVRVVTEHLGERLARSDPGKGVRNYTGEPACDAILSRFATWADSEGIPFQVELERPHGMKPQDMCLILMNALENAFQALVAQSEGTPRFVRVQSSTAHGQYFFEMTNTCRPGSAVIREGERLPFTSQDGHGYGTRSIASVLVRHGAVYRFQTEKDRFHFRFLLPEYETGEPRS